MEIYRKTLWDEGDTGQSDESWYEGPGVGCKGNGRGEYACEDEG